MRISRPPRRPGLTARVAWWALAMAATIGRPRPRPWSPAARWADRRWNGWRSRPIWAAGMTGPVLVIMNVERPRAEVTSTLRSPPGRLWRSALSIRLAASCRRRRSSPTTGAGGVRLAGAQDLCGDAGEVEGLPAVQAALAAGQGQQRVDQPFLLLSFGEHVLACRAQRGGGSGRVGEGHLQHGP